MAMRHNRLVVFTGALGALVVMTVLSAVMGFALPSLLPRAYTHYAACALFAVFGVRLLKEVMEEDGDGPNEELEEVSLSLLHFPQLLRSTTSMQSIFVMRLTQVEHELEKKDGPASFDLDNGGATSSSSSSRRSNPVSLLQRLVSPIFIQAFTMTFLAEWGTLSLSLSLSRCSCFSFANLIRTRCWIFLPLFTCSSTIPMQTCCCVTAIDLSISAKRIGCLSHPPRR
jgi:putative Ca2+/H+ antiporter (TMEM165/GDT1 family)